MQMHDLTQISRRGKYCITLHVLYPLPQSESSAQVHPAARTSQAREEVYGGKGFLLATQFNYRCLGIWNVMDAGPAPMQGCSGHWRPHRAASREELGFTTHLSRLPQDYWRKRNVPEKISQLLLKGTAFSAPFRDGHSSTAPDTLLQLAAPTGASPVSPPRLTLGCLCPPGLPLMCK